MSKTAEPAKPDLEHLSWAIDQRAEIQHTLLALYEFVRRYSSEAIIMEDISLA